MRTSGQLPTWQGDCPVIYFVHDSVSAAVKIGHAADAGKRLLGLQTGNPNELVLLGTLPGDRPQERQLHQRFAEHHRRGEWFHAPEAVLATIRRMLLTGGYAQTVGAEVRRRNWCRHGLRDVPVVILGEPQTPLVVSGSHWNARRDLLLDLWPPGSREVVRNAQPRGQPGALTWTAAELLRAEIVDPPGTVLDVPADRVVLMGHWESPCDCWLN
jgi:Meiotically Up-regulated Gene 113 (MUG113) protein